MDELFILIVGIVVAVCFGVRGRKHQKKLFTSIGQVLFAEEPWKIEPRTSGFLGWADVLRLRVKREHGSLLVWQSPPNDPSIVVLFEIEHEARVKVIKRSGSALLNKPLGWDEVEFGRADFDEYYIAWAKDDFSKRAIAGNEKLKRLLEFLKEDTNFLLLALLPTSVRKERRKAFAANEASLACYRPGIMVNRTGNFSTDDKDLSYLKSLSALLSEIEAV